MEYYTYAYLREDRTPYYIGKGKDNRAYKRTKKCIKPPKDKSRIIFLKQNLTEEEAFKHEKYMIAVFGRKDLGTGILHNKTDGGEGSSGIIRSPETRSRISAAKKGKPLSLSPETRERMSAARKNMTPETRAKLSAVNKGKIISPETRAKISDAKKGKSRLLETRAKLSAAKKGKKPYDMTEEIRARISATKKSKPHSFSPETRKRMSEAQKGEKNHNYGKIWITNGIESRKISKNDTIPEGFRKGRTFTKRVQETFTIITNVI